ncbi:MAG: thermonuclease, TNase, micrococcal nuclease [Chloroflexi bacterium]|nr:thermonuclease, TNase, micrococcal nuclease [Chloroflexota bacterium]
MRRRSFLFGTVVSIAIILTVSGCFTSGDLVTQQILDDARARRDRSLGPSPTAIPTPPTPSPTPTPTRTPQPGRTFATVVRVWDGNTVLIDGGASVRYIGVNTPGGGMFGRPLEPFGREAAERNLELVEGKQIEIEDDAADVDGSGVMLRYVYIDGVMINQVLLEEGLARLAPLGPNNRYATELRNAEAEARRAPLNIWTLITSTPTMTPVPSETPLPSPTLVVQPVLAIPRRTATPTINPLFAPAPSATSPTPSRTSTPTAVRP